MSFLDGFHSFDMKNGAILFKKRVVQKVLGASLLVADCLGQWSLLRATGYVLKGRNLNLRFHLDRYGKKKNIITEIKADQKEMKRFYTSLCKRN